MASPRVEIRRRDGDIIKLFQSNHEVTGLDEANNYAVKFYGPSGTPYEDGVWNIRLHLTDEYPFKSPSVGFMNCIFHPNIDHDSGTVCLNVLNHAWSPLYDLCKIFDIFLPQLLTYPNPTDPLNPIAAAMLLKHPHEYYATVRKHVKKFASKNSDAECETDESDMSESVDSDFSDSEQGEV